MRTGERIKHLRIQLELSQEQLGALVGVQKAAIYKYENGLVINLKRSMIEKLADVLKTTPAYLMGWTDMPYVSDEKRTVLKDEDSLSTLDVQLMDLLRYLTDDQKKLLLAQIELKSRE